MTKSGIFHLQEPPIPTLSALRELLPYGIARLKEPQEGARFGIPMRCGEKEMRCMMAEQKALPEAEAMQEFEESSLLMVRCLTVFARVGFSGALLPTISLRKVKPGLCSLGLALFVFPSKTGMESQEFDSIPEWDSEHGTGAGVMLETFQSILKEQGSGTKLGSGLDFVHAPTDAPRRLAFSFLSLGSELICLQRKIDPEHDQWALLYKNYGSELYHLPMLPMLINRNDLVITKGLDESEF